MVLLTPSEKMNLILQIRQCFTRLNGQTKYEKKLPMLKDSCIYKKITASFLENER